ncbi:polyphosphate kinase 2 family protein [Advenella mimigardefordensis]|uniref:Putative polyphosphate:nucleotide phosphotransferase, PPK2 family n=1 Tax=Advenella mimigardefordensis (strain DSM 17166 / LMG 22922 / DPN7) TaxID=1247726 RepID=W0PDG9_ADVMD|nr:polyphosphate kinase 2 family protein [Advenella mimigardefordensis]AHG63507.1 putative polyphosphate:nucleotide phosphotransferase, PPK2 family [Advenella mimigardefordensis DPN7]
MAELPNAGFSDQFRVTNGKKFSLKKCSTDPQAEPDKKDAEKKLQELVASIADLQNVLYADNRWSLLLIFQAMDAAGKDSTIKNLLSGVNPQGCEVYAFKRPSEEELSHDFLWRTTKCLPQRGNIGVFNRSYYEETLVVRVHPGILDGQHLPKACRTENIWDERFEDIRHFEKHMDRSGTKVLKFFLHISLDEQKKRFLERLDNPAKNWKFESADLEERKFWKEYMVAYEETIKNTASDAAPWYVIPGNDKPYARLAVADAVLQTLQSLDLTYPKLEKDEQKNLAGYKTQLEQEQKKQSD